MALLGAFNYDPSTSANKGTALAAMTAVDTTNCRVTFTAPAAGAGTGTRDVLVRIRAEGNGGTSGLINSWLFGVLEGSTVLARQAPIGSRLGAASSARNPLCAEFVIKNISSGSHSYDLAIGVENATNASGVSYGGPNNATTNDAWGAITMEVWEATNLLAASNYDPTTQASLSTGSLQAMTAIDTTNLRCTFTAPASGNVFVVMRGNWIPPSTSITVSPIFGILESATVVARQVPMGGAIGGSTITANSFNPMEAAFPVTGISAGSHNYDAALGVEINLASSNFKYGGPDNATANDATGMFRFEVWSA